MNIYDALLLSTLLYFTAYKLKLVYIYATSDK